MEAKTPRVGTKILVSTDDGEQEDEVIRVLVGGTEAGLWVVETMHNGRVVVLRGRDDEWSAAWTARWTA